MVSQSADYNVQHIPHNLQLARQTRRRRCSPHMLGTATTAFILITELTWTTQCCIYETLFKNSLYKFHKKTVLYIYNWLSWLFQQQKIVFLYGSWAVCYISLLCIILSNTVYLMIYVFCSEVSLSYFIFH